jgi:hypothetical protein
MFPKPWRPRKSFRQSHTVGDSTDRLVLTTQPVPSTNKARRPPDGREDLLRTASDPFSLVTPKFEGFANLTLPVQASVGPITLTSAPYPAIRINWSDITQIETLTVDASALGNLLDFRNFGLTDVINALHKVVDYLRTLEGFSFLDEKLPLVNRSIADLLDFADKLGQEVEEIQNNTLRLLLLRERIEENAAAPMFKIEAVGASTAGAALGILGTDTDHDTIIEGKFLGTVTESTLLAKVNGGTGVPNLTDGLDDLKISFQDGTAAVMVRLDGAVTLKDVIDKIELARLARSHRRPLIGAAATLLARRIPKMHRTLTRTGDPESDSPLAHPALLDTLCG